eukprot:SAG22_NODE_2_length_61565_cov_858.782010_73_plen_87_part_00
MIRQFSRKVEKQEIKNLKNATGAKSESLTVWEAKLLPSDLSGYKPGLLELQFDKQNPSSSQDSYNGKMDKTDYYSKPKTNTKFENS